MESRPLTADSRAVRVPYMHFKLTKPCPMCPFRTDCMPGWLSSRAESIAQEVIYEGHTFACHETTGVKGEIPPSGEQHCAGALILAEKMEMPGQMMRIAERLGFYDATKLDMTAPVFDDVEEFIDHHLAE